MPSFKAKPAEEKLFVDDYSPTSLFIFFLESKFHESDKILS